MRKVSVLALALTAISLSSCATQKEDGPKPVGPQSAESKIPWNSPISGQGGGILSAMPKTPRR